MKYKVERIVCPHCGETIDAVVIKHKKQLTLRHKVCENCGYFITWREWKLAPLNAREWSFLVWMFVALCGLSFVGIKLISALFGR